MTATDRRSALFDFRCETCEKRGKGTWTLPVVCSQCSTRGIARISKGHEFYAGKCPNCGTSNLRRDYRALTEAEYAR